VESGVPFQNGRTGKDSGYFVMLKKNAKKTAIYVAIFFAVLYVIGHIQERDRQDREEAAAAMKEINRGDIIMRWMGDR
jgi:preprotein translocase subunit YajC